jgi:uncharacterized protein (TIGR00369 family)
MEGDESKRVPVSDDFKRPSDSDTSITELMVPAYANLGGKIHGGHLLSLMDKVAYACAAKHAGIYCVTVSVDGVDFLQPVDVGDLVTMMARVNYVGRSSVVVGIRVTAENVREGVVKHTNTSYFTMVAKGDDGKPARVPGLLLSTRDDVRRFTESLKRRELREARRESMRVMRDAFDLDSRLAILSGQNCEVRLEQERST